MRKFSVLLIMAFFGATCGVNSNAADLASAAPKTKTVVILYSSIGKGHYSASTAIQEAILKEAPGTKVVLKDIRDFIPSKTYAKANEKFFWYIVKNHPTILENGYQNLVDRGTKAAHLSEIKSSYNSKMLKKWLAEQTPDAVIATHYGAAIELGSLREAGDLQNVRTAWLHTDYNVAHFPRISQSVDATYLGVKELQDNWEKAGVDAAKSEVTGMPVKADLFKPFDRKAFMISQGLDVDKPLITIASGAEGVGDFPAMVSSLKKSFGDKPVQIVAVCGNNESAYKKLIELQKGLPENIHLHVKGFDPNLTSFVRSSSVYITKSGGLSPTEGFAVNVPMVLLDVFGAHERENAKLFQKMGLADLNQNPHFIGDQVTSLLNDETKRKAMLAKQAEFRSQMDITAIKDFALHGKEHPFAPVDTDFGVAGGSGASAQGVLKKLDQDAPADFEILLSNSMQIKNRFLEHDANPFGHIAFRIDDKVYTTAQEAVPGSATHLLHPQSLEQYLYGTKATAPNLVHGSNYGLSYARDTMGLRIRGVTPTQKEKMLAEIAKINSDFALGKVCYHKSSNNCADLTDRILRAGGIAKGKVQSNQLLPSMPLTKFDQYLEGTRKNPQLGLDLISYQRFLDSHNEYRYSHFPLSADSPVRAVSAVLNEQGQIDKYPITKRIGTYPGGATAYENLDHTSIKEMADARAASIQDLIDRRIQLELTEKTLERHRTALERKGITAGKVEEEMNTRLKALGPKGREAFATGDFSKLNPKQKKSVEELKEFVKSADQDLGMFQDSYDEFHMKKIEYYLDSIYSDFEVFRKNMQGHLTGSTGKKVNAVMDELAQAYDDYHKTKVLYGMPKDVERIDAHRLFYKKVSEMYTTVDHAIGAEGTVVEKKFFEAFRAKLASATEALKVGAIVPDTADIIYNLYAKTQTPVGQTPLTDSMFRAWGKLKDLAGYKVKIIGAENIPKLVNPKTVNVYTFVHNHPQLDQFSLAELFRQGHIEHFGIYGAADTFSPKALADKMDISDHFVVVGRGSNKPIEKTKLLLDKKGIRNLVIFPEGSVSAGMYETRPVREKFSWGLLKMMRERGYDVNVIPISMPDNFRFNTAFHLNPKTENELRVVVHPAITHDMQNVLAASANDVSINHLLRENWLGDFATNETTLLGAPRLSHMDDKVRDYLGGHFNPPRERCDPLATIQLLTK